MAHWSDRWLGTPWVADAYDCASLAQDVLRQQFGRTIDLPGRSSSFRARDAQVAAGVSGSFRPAAPPREGDIVLMRLHGRRAGIGHHVGVWCEPDGEPHVLHLPAGIGACRHPLAGLSSRGWDVVGVYRPDPIAEAVPGVERRPRGAPHDRPVR